MKLIGLALFLFGIFIPKTNSIKIKNNVEPILHYIVREPIKKNNKPPLIILMHGLGSNEKDLFSFANQLPDSFLVISVRAPYTIGKDSYAWYQLNFIDGKPISNKDQAEKSRQLIIQFINQLKEKHSINNDRIYLCGFSQGAIMAYGVGLTNPNEVKGIAAMSGYLLDEVKSSVVSNDKLKKLQIFISHGINDHVLGIHYARESNEYLKKLGLSPKYKEYHEGHTISIEMLNDLIKWLNYNK